MSAAAPTMATVKQQLAYQEAVFLEHLVELDNVLVLERAQEVDLLDALGFELLPLDFADRRLARVALVVSARNSSL
jgi:hypothetical protein